MGINPILMSASNIHIAETTANDRYMTVQMRMLSTRANLNKCMVSEAFIDNIVANADDYVAMPQCADTKKLKGGDYHGLGHMLDTRTGNFLSEMIGSFVSFEKVNDEYGVSLMGTARIAKRSAAICSAIQDLYSAGKLNFSFEIMAEDLREHDGITFIDASPNNHMTAMAVVSTPAYPEATAMSLVAETSDSIDEEAPPEGKDIFAGAKIQLSEIDFTTVRSLLLKAYWEHFCDADGWGEVLIVSPTCMIIYEQGTARTLKMEYVIEGDNIVVTDCYEVAFVRKVGIAEMSEDIKKIAEEATAETVEEVVAEEVASEVTEEPTVSAPDEAAQAIAEAQATIEALKAELEELKLFKEVAETLKAEKAAAELKQKQDALRAYASANKLDVENEVVAKAIAEVNYEALVVEAMKNIEVDMTKSVSAAVWDEVKPTEISDPYGGILARVTN